MIRLRDLQVCYDGPPVLRDVTLNVDRGESVLITGPSGCGKSTLARAICGLIPHSIPATVKGDVAVVGLAIRNATIPEIARRVGMVFQNPSSQLFHLRVEDEIAFGPRNLGWDEEAVSESVTWALETTGLADLRDRRPAELSGGQKQCVAIAAALAMRPELLVLDEPTASLDVPSSQRVMRTLQTLRERQNVTIVIIEHRLAEVVPVVDRAIVMNDGCVVADGPCEELLADRAIRELLGLRRPVDERMSSWRTLIHPNGKRRRDCDPVLLLEKVSAGYGKRMVVSDVDLALYPGDFVALVGDNGVGKSTLALVAAGLIKPSCGQVRFRNGQRPRPGLDVTLLFQNPAEQLFTDSVDDEVSFAPRNYGIFSEGGHREVMRVADLDDLSSRRPTMLSVGQQQRTALAACISLFPQVLILDEPTLGQDWGHLQQLMAFLKGLSRQGTAILLVSHDFKLVHHFARRIVLMEEGRIKLEGRVAVDGRT